MALLAACAQPTGLAATEDLQNRSGEAVNGYAVVKAAYCGREPAAVGDPCSPDGTPPKVYKYVVPAGPVRPWRVGTNIPVLVTIRGEGESTTDVVQLPITEARDNCWKAEGPTREGNTLGVTRGCDRDGMDEWKITHSLRGGEEQKALDVVANIVLVDSMTLPDALNLAGVESGDRPDELAAALSDRPTFRRYALASGGSCTSVVAPRQAGRGTRKDDGLRSVGAVCVDLSEFQPPGEKERRGPRLDARGRALESYLVSGDINDADGNLLLKLQRRTNGGGFPEWSLYDSMGNRIGAIQAECARSTHVIDSHRPKAAYEVVDKTGAVIARSAVMWTAENENRSFHLYSSSLDPGLYALLLSNTAMHSGTYSAWHTSGRMDQACSPPVSQP